MPVQEEKCFPRGGKEPPDEKPKLLKRKRELADALPFTTGRKAKVSKKTSVKNLSLTSLSEGMIILGTVREVSNLELKVNLPGLVIGYVPTTNISEEYNAYLKELLRGEEKDPQELSDMFKPGQLVVTRVEDVSTVIKKTKVTLSLNPKRIQGDLSVLDIMEGLMLSVSVQSDEDRVYVMNCGIPSVRAVLKKAQALKYQDIWNDGKPLGVGQVLRCLVTKCTTSEGSSNVELTADPEKLSEAYVEKNDTPLNSTIVGKCFQLSVAKAFSSGLLVNLTSNQTGYVHSNNLTGNCNNIEENSLLQGRVLYIEPLTRNIFLTALENVCGPHPLPPPFQEFRKGTKFSEAKVISSKGGNVLLELGKLSSNVYGLVSHHHLDLDDNVETNKSYSDLVKEKYPPGSRHECKVLEYDYMIQKYICTLNRSTIKQKYSSVDELIPGLLTTCIVERSSLRGIFLKLYSIRGFVEPVHCSDEPVRYPDTLFTKGQKVKAKVLAVKNPICEFTLKPALVNSKSPILTKFSDAKYGELYDGVVVTVSSKGLLVKFYADFKIFVSANHVLGSKTGNLEGLYHIGQLVKCQVSKICDEEEKLFLNVQPYETYQSKSEKKRKSPLKVGEPYTVVVKEITPEGLLVEECDKGVTGRVPMTQLTDSPQISMLLCQTYKKGDRLQAYCLNGEDEIVFTLSSTIIKYFESPFGKDLCKNGLSGLQEGMIVPSTVAQISSDELILSLPIHGESCSVSVTRRHLCNGIVEDVVSLGIQKDQTLMVRILRIFEGSIQGTCNFNEVCDKSIMSENGIMLLQDFMKAQKRIHDFWKNDGNPLGELEIGSQVEGMVVAVTSLGAVVDLDNGARAVVMPIHIDKDLDLKINMHVKGTVMYLDIVNQCVEITLWKHVQRKFSSHGKVLDVGKHKNGFVFISRSDLLVCGINHFETFYITYVPSRWHINDLRPTPFFPVGVREPVTVRACDGDLIFAVPRKVELYERRYRSDKEQIKFLASYMNSAAAAESNEEFLSLQGEEEMEKSKDEIRSDDENEKLEGSTEFTNQKTFICSENVTQETNYVNESVNIPNPVEREKRKENLEFEGLEESIDFSQHIKENHSELQADNSEKIIQKKKKKRKSHEAIVNEIEIMEERTVSLNNENLEVFKSKKPKKMAGKNKSLSFNESSDFSQCVEENIKQEENIENKVQKKKKKKKSNVLEKSINEIEKLEESSMSVNNEKDCSKNEINAINNLITSGINEFVNNEDLAEDIKSKKQKKKVRGDKSCQEPNSIFHIEDNFENEVNNEKKVKKKKDDCIRKEIEEINNQSQTSDKNEDVAADIKSKKQKKKDRGDTSCQEPNSIFHIQDNFENEGNIEKEVKKKKDDCIRKEIEEINNHSQTSDKNEPANNEDVAVDIKKKKQKRKSKIDESWITEKSTDLSQVQEDISEPVTNKEEIKSQMKKKKKKENSLLISQNDVEMMEEGNDLVNRDDELGSKCEEPSNHLQRKNENKLANDLNLSKETKNGNQKRTSKFDNKENERQKKNQNNFPEKCEGSEQKKNVTSYLNVCAGFFWNATPDQLPAVNKQKTDDIGSSSEDETEVNMNKKKKQRLSMVEKRELARQEEERLRKIEERLMDAERNPVSADDFDRLVMSAPNDSRNWIKYMAYHLEATEVGKARAVAERALKTISFREEQDKLNMWMALLNLENLYGTQESLETTLEEAVKMNDSYKLHMQVLNMYSMTKKLEELDKMVQLVTKKYKSQKITWMEAGLAYMKCGEIEKSRQLMQRALKILDKRDHVEVITRFARLENEWGELERAETLMENILTSYPKRVDVWNVYVDMLVKSKKFDIARQVLDRAVIQKLPAAKMKSLFKKYLNFEQAHGTSDRVEKVREMAKNYVENLKSDIA